MVQHNSIDHTGLTGVGGSAASNANQVSTGNTGGAASTFSRGDHVHLGVTSLAHTSNTWSGPVTLQAEGTIGITKPNATTIAINATGAAAAAGGGSGTELLGLTAYGPSGDNTYSVTTTSDADVDATNLTVTFTAPASGNVLVKMSSLMNDGNFNAHWTVRESSSTVGESYISSGVNKAIRAQANIYITGISAGSHTYKFGAYTSGGTMSIHYGTTSAYFGKIIMEVWACP